MRTFSTVNAFHVIVNATYASVVLTFIKFATLVILLLHILIIGTFKVYIVRKLYQKIPLSFQLNKEFKGEPTLYESTDCLGIFLVPVLFAVICVDSTRNEKCLLTK